MADMTKEIINDSKRWREKLRNERKPPIETIKENSDKNMEPLSQKIAVSYTHLDVYKRQVLH